MTATVIPFTSCPVCYSYRLKLHRVTGDLLEVVRTEYAAHLAAGDNPRHPRPPEQAPQESPEGGRKMRRPGPGVKLTEEERHAWHHHLIAERKAAYYRLPGRSGLARDLRREAIKRAWWTLTGHLVGEHSYGRRAASPFLAMTWAEVEAIHAQLHEVDKRPDAGKVPPAD